MTDSTPLLSSQKIWLDSISQRRQQFIQGLAVLDQEITLLVREVESVQGLEPNAIGTTHEIRNYQVVAITPAIEDTPENPRLTLHKKESA